jgi:GT2 family glycosyltransferase/glycosyltransferase involved in cell wall biosynthesis
LDRAWRLTPRDPTVALALATACLGHDDSRAEALFAGIVAEHDVREAWLGLATARRRLGNESGASAALAEVRRRHVLDADAAAVAKAIGTPAAFRNASERPTPTVGCVSARDGGLVGWAWHPGDPGRDPVLTIKPLKGQECLTVKASDTTVEIQGLLARPRGFAVPELPFRGPVRVLGSDGKDLLGSPLHPRPNLVPLPVATAKPRRQGSRRRFPVDVVIPVHGGLRHTMACLDSVLTALRRGSRLIVIDDASEEPELVAALDALHRRRRIILIRHRRTRGFPTSANAGIRAAGGHDVVLLNSDTLVAPGWLDALRAVAYSAPDIGTVTPLSNDGTIVTYQHGQPDLLDTIRLDVLARRANGLRAVDIPVGVGFCLYLRRACLNAVGPFRADIFAQGYGEENDFCLRARDLGWRSVAAPGVFVAHVGGQSFGGAAAHLRARNAALLEQLHPGYEKLIEAHVRRDPMAQARRRLDLARWRNDRRRGSRSMIIVSHAEGGGVERRIHAAAERHRANGLRVIVLRPARDGAGRRCVVVGDEFPDLRYAMPDEAGALQRLLLAERPIGIELHHLVGHHHAITELIGALGTPYEVHVHDYAWLCGRVALVGPEDRYCGEPGVAQCELCVARGGNLIDEDIKVAALRRRSAKLLAGARCVVVPSEDARVRIRRHFPLIRPQVQPHEDDLAIQDPPPILPAGPRRVCVIGAIGVHKGFQVLLDCARDADARDLPLEFVVVGHTIDDRALLATGRVFVTGPYAANEAVTLIKAQRASLALLPSIFPETWCFALGEAWQAGLRVVAFDIGAQAERIRRTCRGILLPLGLFPAQINNALVAEA